MSIKKNLIEIFKSSKFTLKEAYDAKFLFPPLVDTVSFHG